MSRRREQLGAVARSPAAHERPSRRCAGMGSERVSKPILVVGAGFAGSTYARELADQGFSVDVIDKRPHIGGNAYDEVAPSGVRIHKYGPHLFHTNNEEVVLWLARFGDFVPTGTRSRPSLPTAGACRSPSIAGPSTPYSEPASRTRPRSAHSSPRRPFQ